MMLTKAHIPAKQTDKGKDHDHYSGFNGRQKSKVSWHVRAVMPDS